MKKAAIILLFISQLAYSANYYVATPAAGGSDSNPGTLASPFATWLRGFQALTNAGDTLFIRGGIYDLSSHMYLTSGVGGQGTRTSPIVVTNYPGESPVLDCDNLNAESGWDISGKNFWQFIGLTVRHVYQDGQAVKVSAIGVSGCNNVHFINCISHDNGGSGFVFASNDTVYIRNCDSYNNCDSLGEPGGELGGKADGFQMYCYDCTTDTDGWQMTYFDQCRAWNNSDDGWDFLRNTKAVVDSCWAIYNGYPLNGSGQGMKAGLPDQDPPSSQYIFTNNVSVYNKSGGFRDNCNNQLYHIDSRWYNNTAAFNAGAGFQSSINPLAKMNTNIMRNNISFSNPSPYYFEDISIWTQDHNSWNPGINLTNADFISVDSTGITAARQVGGGLPDNDCYNYFLKLAGSSDLIDGGVDVGIIYSGDAPDLGPFEYNIEEAPDSTATDIAGFEFADQTGAATINTANHTVSIEVDYTVDVTNLTPTITLSYGATIVPASGVARDFTSAVPYTVTALDGETTQEWTVTVTQEAAPEEPPTSSSKIVKIDGYIIKL